VDGSCVYFPRGAFLVVLCGFPTRTSRIPAIAAQESPESALIVVATLTVERLRIQEATSLDLGPMLQLLFGSVKVARTDRERSGG
jgi:hypothetical protein